MDDTALTKRVEQLEVRTGALVDNQRQLMRHVLGDQELGVAPYSVQLRRTAEQIDTLSDHNQEMRREVAQLGKQQSYTFWAIAGLFVVSFLTLFCVVWIVAHLS